MKIGHVAIYTKDLEQSKEFYVKYFGGKSNEGYHNKTTEFRSYFLEFDEGASLELMTKPLLPQKTESEVETTGIAHLAFFLSTKEEVDSLTKCIIKDGYRLLSGPRTTGDGYYESCIADPDGNRIEIVTI